MPKKKIVILGDSTIDNRVWLGKEKYRLFVDNTYPFLSPVVDFLAWFNPFKPKSVVENLREQMPHVEFIDRTNDGFTTHDVLHGAYRDKVFGRGAHRFFPHEHFKPLDSDELKKADQIILSIGGNNFREFIQAALTIHNEQNRKAYIEKEYPKVFEKLRSDYKEILKNIAKMNPKANIVLMTQYYPALHQKTLLGTNIYDFMTILGTILKRGNALDTIVEVMKDTYNDILQFVAKDKSMSNIKLTVVDVTSSLNPNLSENFEGQIEPSDIGGKRIAKMLSHVVQHNAKSGKQIYRFAPGFFNNADQSFVHTTPLNAKTTISPVHPIAMPKPLSTFKKIGLIIGGATIVGTGFGLILGGSFIVAGIASIAGGLLGSKIAKVSTSSVNDRVYRFKTDVKHTTNKEMQEFGKQAAKAWIPYLKSCFPFSGAYQNEDFNLGYAQELERKAKPKH
jgi:lysophospholipase L1-like esterase